MRSVFGKVTALALVSALASVAVVGCSTKDDSHVGGEKDAGSIGLNFVVAPGINVDSVHYVVTGPLLVTPITGDINVSDPAATVSALIGGLLEGGGYHIELTATSTGVPPISCLGGADFSVTAGASTSVSIDMQCSGEETRGELIVNGTFNSCPSLTSWIAAPLQVSTSGQIAVSAAATDLNAANTLSFAWTATGGTFVAPAAASTSYNCSAAGAQTLTVTVTDGSCSDFATIQVSCVAVLCGNGALDPNETCDDGNLVSGDGCPSDCSLVCGDNVVEEGETCDDGNTAGGDNCPADCTQVCGDGVLESPEVCDDGNTVGGDLCNATCTQATSLCGNGVINGTEACDDGNQVNGDGCENNCTITPIQGFCGDGISGNSPAEECDKGGGANSSGTTSCSNDCQSVASAACLDCELAGDCGEFAIDGCAAVTGTAPNGQLRTNNCYSVLECLRDSGCGETGSVTECYCGTLATGVCVAAPNSGAGAPNGPCKEVIEDALETESPQEVLTSFTSLSLAGGWALSRVTCDKTQCLAQCF